MSANIIAFPKVRIVTSAESSPELDDLHLQLDAVYQGIRVLQRKRRSLAMCIRWAIKRLDESA